MSIIKTASAAIRDQKKWQILILFVVCILTEVFIFNANSFRLIPRKNYTEKIYSVHDVLLSNAEIDPFTGEIVYTGDGGAYLFIELKDLDTKVGTVRFAPFSDENVLPYWLVYTDEANAEYYRGFERVFVRGVEKTEWINCHFDGVSQKMIFRFEGLKNGFRFRLDDILINHPIPFSFSEIRFATIFLFAVFIWSLRRTSFWLAATKTSKHNLVLVITILLFILAGIVLRANGQNDQYLKIMYNKDFVDALEQGQLHLDIPVDPKLAEMDNPYDTSLRGAIGAESSWDTAFYDGRYYCYFGIVPALFFYLPYKLLTGSYMGFATLTAFVYGIFLFLIDVILIKMMRRLTPNAPFGAEFISLLITNAVTNYFVYMTEPTFYRMFYAVGMMFTAAGMFCFVTWYFSEKKRRVLLFFGALCLALSVGCRPPLLAYTLIIVPFGISYLRQQKKKAWPDAVCLLLPYVVIGGLLAAYNYLRFDSITEFGTSYQLTAQDQLHSIHTWGEIPTLLWLSVFQPLSVRATFPFVMPGDPVHQFTGHFYVGPNITSLLGQAPVLILLFCPFVWKKWKEKKTSFSFYYMLFANLLMIVLLIFELMYSGVEWRYTTEMVPVFAVSLSLLFGNLIADSKESVQKTALTAYGLGAIIAVAIAFFRAIDGEFHYVLSHHPTFYYAVERLFNCW